MRRRGFLAFVAAGVAGLLAPAAAAAHHRPGHGGGKPSPSPDTFADRY